MSNIKPPFDAPAGGLLEPIGLDDFFKTYWEQKPLHIARATTNPFDALISIDVIETLLSTQQLKFPTIQLSQAGQSIPASEYTDNNDQIVGSRIIDRYNDGSTIVVSFAHRLVANLMSLCRAVESSMLMRCQTNVYLSPAGNQGFNPHFDTHDVFILQVAGKKTFNFYSAGAHFPTSADRFNSEHHRIGDKTEEISLSAGDTLYIPRGFVHDAVADINEPSLHVTLGVYPVLLHTLVDEVMQLAVDTDPRMRRAISQSAWMQQDDAGNTTRLITEVLQEQVHEGVVQQAIERLRDEFALETVQDCQGALSNSMAAVPGPDTKLTVILSNVLYKEHGHAGLKLGVFGQVLELSGTTAAAVDWLLQHKTAQLQTIPGLDLDDQLALVERLRLAGVVRW